MNNNYYEYLANFNNISDNQEGGGRDRRVYVDNAQQKTWKSRQAIWRKN